MSSQKSIRHLYPWCITPMIISAPMRDVAGADLATAVSAAGGLGFIAGGDDVSTLEAKLIRAQSLVAQYNARQTSPDDNRLVLNEGQTLPVGVGLINWGADIQIALPLVIKYRPCAVWLFAPLDSAADLLPWVEQIRDRTGGGVSIWVQVGNVEDSCDAVAKLSPDVLVVQGTDGGGHGLRDSASLISLLPEVVDRIQSMATRADATVAMPKIVAAGGLMDGRGAAAAFTLGAEAVVMGTRFLASLEAEIPKEYQQAVVATRDGGRNTTRSHVFDTARGTARWPSKYQPRGIKNQTYTDFQAGKVTEAANYDQYQQALSKGDEKYGDNGRIDTFLGTGVGLVGEVLPAGEIVRRIARETEIIMRLDRLSRL
ncbi:hypothetical protein BJY04DRAFT_176709 [Aspergillus karnatakaensis]|uniref:nitronate monooxygenase n=1 Tax=Aspergillus karnatakaensis TaxID=1810916 RepID=UPI003CCD2C65